MTTASVSCVSVSPNKYTSLVVEDVNTQCTTDCADTTASLVSPSIFNSATVLSTGVLRSGLAPDVKSVQIIHKGALLCPVSETEEKRHWGRKF